MGGIDIDIWEKSIFFGSIGSQKCTKTAIFSQGGLLTPPLPHVGLIAKNNKNLTCYRLYIHDKNNSNFSELKKI